MKTAIQFIITGCRDIKEKGEAMKKQKGSLTLEAALFLTMFMMGYMAFMDGPDWENADDTAVYTG